MDVTLVLTHRCNLACTYCYAGEHFRKEMSRETIEGGLDLLFADDPPTAELAFFGGEPFLAYPAMVRAIVGARRRAARRGAPVTFQCTTNGTLVRGNHARTCADTGMRITVSIDGIRAAHDRNRPRPGGASSWDAAVEGLRALRQAGAAVDAMIVITPATAPFLAGSVNWLWDEGVSCVRANPDFRSRWTLGERDLLTTQLSTVGRDMAARRARDRVSFEPLARRGRSSCATRRRVVVGADGKLYPCAPMVGEGRDDATQIGHLDDGPAAILERVDREGASCGGAGRVCPCACYLETGDRTQPGPNYLWFGETCAEIRALMASPARRLQREVEAPGRPRRAFVLRAGGLVLATGAATAALLYTGEPERLAVPDPTTTADDLAPAARVAPLRQPPPEPAPQATGGVPPRYDRSLPEAAEPRERPPRKRGRRR